jgi:hypothetical protein
MKDMSLTTDPKHPGLGYGSDNEPVEQNRVYLVLSQEELAKGFVKPFRTSYKHLDCGTTTTMNKTISDTYARDPWFYGSTYCCVCQKHRPLNEFVWEPDGESMDPGKWPADEHKRISALRESKKG